MMRSTQSQQRSPKPEPKAQPGLQRYRQMLAILDAMNKQAPSAAPGSAAFEKALDDPEQE